MRIHHTITNRAPWGPSDHLACIDNTLANEGSIPLEELDVGSFYLEHDGEHYTRNEYRRFVHLFKKCVENMPYPLIVSDSTIGWHDWTDDWVWTGWASDHLRTALSGQCVVDVVCGSGFVARAHQNEHFYTRVSHHLRTNPGITDVVLVGGWNDEGRTAQACAAARRLVSLVQRY